MRESFTRGFSSGLVVLIVWFLVRLGGLAPFPPESALTSFLSVIPESLQEPAVQTLGEGAGLLGLLVATLVAAAAYGLLSVAFERYFLGRFPADHGPTSLERTLVYAFVPWLFFGAGVLPLTGVSFFGLGSSIASPGLTWAFPLTMLVMQFLWGLLLWSRLPVPIVPKAGAAAENVPRDTGRRTFIEKGLILAGSAVVVLASLGSALGSLASEGGLLSQGGVPILPGTPINSQNAPAIFSDPRLAELVDSEVTDNDSFYRVAIDVFDPDVAVSDWSLALGGLVSNPKGYSLPDLQSLPKVEEYDTFACVSNLVNGDLISNAKWGGVRLSDLFADAGGVSQGAQYVVFRSVDGYSVGIPLARALEPGSMLAYEMNGMALPQRHGYPLRAVIPGLYGMMSAKWVRQIELSNAEYLGYWQTRGWSSDATVQTAAFVRVPQDGATVSLSQNDGSVMIGGIAFAGDRGISKVEVSVDGGKTWEQAVLKPPASELSWALWAYEWHPQGPGAYTIYARATDGNNDVQVAVQSGPFPAGATGYVMSDVNVGS
jgi:DMSO/TMAO reductase YedYZ molybdopterin-dependent catalytic subunit